MSETPQEDWNEEAVYDAEIAPLMTQIIAICERAKIPMIASFAYAKSHAGDGCMTISTTSVVVDNRSVPLFALARLCLTRDLCDESTPPPHGETH